MAICGPFGASITAAALAYMLMWPFATKMLFTCSKNPHPPEHEKLKPDPIVLRLVPSPFRFSNYGTRSKVISVGRLMQFKVHHISPTSWADASYVGPTSWASSPPLSPRVPKDWNMWHCISFYHLYKTSS